MPVVPISSQFTLSEDAQIGKYQIKAGVDIMANFNGLHKNPAQWQQPNQFLPDRFDFESPLSLTPDGKKRHPFSFCPFNGGKRVCFGKTFAEVNMKIVATYITQCFDMEFVDTELYPDTHHLPMAMLGQSHNVPIMVRLTPNESTKKNGLIEKTE